VLRCSLGLFTGYFFLSVLFVAHSFYAYKDFDFTGPLMPVFQLLRGPSGFYVFVCTILLGIFSSMLFTANLWARLNASIVFIIYILTYNFHLCINQPHVAYINYILLSYIFLPQDREIASRSIRLVYYLFLIQMTISGWSKLQMPEWRQGEIIGILAEVRDPAPGIYLAHLLPLWFQKLSTWMVLAVESISFFAIFSRKLRAYLWWAHFLFFCSIILLVPYATHVAAAMVIFLFFVHRT
jgi:hypothetical protein